MEYFIVVFKQFDYEDDFNRIGVIKANSEHEAIVVFKIENPHGEIGSIELTEVMDGMYKYE